MDGLRTKRASPQMAVRELGPNLAVFSEALAMEGSVGNYSANSDDPGGSVAMVAVQPPGCALQRQFRGPFFRAQDLDERILHAVDHCSS